MWQLLKLRAFDVLLPDGHGFELRNPLHRRSNAPATLLTARDTAVDRMRDLELSADGWSA